MRQALQWLCTVYAAFKRRLGTFAYAGHDPAENKGSITNVFGKKKIPGFDLG